LLQNSERHPCAPNSIFYVSRILGTYHKSFAPTFLKSQSAFILLLLLPKSQPLRWVVIWDRRSAAFFDFAEISVLTVICIKITRPFGVVIFMNTVRTSHTRRK
ncbi:hypothetical protein, partial [Flavonifractor plautii]|uniref:hypothetical protein n=5 Tax=Flavonifractor TaxID=946234 RepID=UPI00232E2D34